jgi:(2Fe-2S) ferredoxin
MTDSAPFYRAHLFFCTHRRPPEHPRGDCASHEAEALAHYLKARIKERALTRVRVNTAGCLHRCRLGPALVVYPDGVWYTYRNEADLDEILETHLIQGGRVSRLLLPDRAAESHVASQTGEPCD